MQDAVQQTVKEVGWKLRSLYRSSKYHTDAELVNLYKARVLGYLEYRTPALYHATDTVLQPLDDLQNRFLRQAGVTPLEALLVFNLAPLNTRRDVAMLGVIHRAALKKGPEHFHCYFSLDEEHTRPGTRLQSRRAKHGRQLKEYRAGTHLNVLRRSVFGLVTVYNLLPAWVVQLKDVKDFQYALQEHVKERAYQNCEDWHLTYSPRLPLYRHPLR